MIIPYGKQFISRSDVAEVKKSLKKDLITTGDYVLNFENEIKKNFNPNMPSLVVMLQQGFIWPIFQ